MEPEYIYTKKESADLREKIINYTIVPQIQLVFSRYPQIRSAMLLVAQYYGDEALDAVHCEMIYSVLPSPAWGCDLLSTDYDDLDPVNLPGLPSLSEINDSIREDFYKLEDRKYYWEHNGNAIPTFAAYCKEGSHQEMNYLEAYSPYAVFRWKDEEIEIEVVGNMLRPWLDGMRPLME
jgi:hypothetical protein